MGRKCRFSVGQVVRYRGLPCVVVDYRQDRKGRGTYRLVRLTHLPAGRGFGSAVWVPSEKIGDHPPVDNRHTAVSVVKANDKLEPDRGCACQCCAHVSIPLGVILSSGELKESHVS